jgi:polyisoprenyl-teichoic acid--peptidoglycan teichoic acid transferase
MVLSAVWPGLGHWYLGDAKVAALLALPPLALLLPLMTAALRGTDDLVAHLVVPANAILLSAFVAVSLVLRLISILLVRLRVGADAARPHRTTMWLLVGIITIPHLIGGYATIGLFGVTSRVFSGIIIDRGDVTQPNATPGIQTLPSVAPPPEENQRISVLLVGSDFGKGYSHSLTDTMIVVSIDPVEGAVVMASIPRDTARFELYSGGTYHDKLNSLMSRASSDPKRYPDGGLGTLSKQIGFMIGVPIDYIAYIDMGGFEAAIDAVGGVDVNVTKAINDNFYQFPNGPKGFHLKKGLQHLDGPHAVAYVRSRYGAGDNDFTRARRQQELLVALRAKLLDPATLPRLPGLLDQISRLVTTNYPPDRIDQLLELSRRVQPDSIKRFVLGPPYAVQPPGGGEYVLVPDMARYAKWSISQFGDLSRYVTK